MGKRGLTLEVRLDATQPYETDWYRFRDERGKDEEVNKFDEN